MIGMGRSRAFPCVFEADISKIKSTMPTMIPMPIEPIIMYLIIFPFMRKDFTSLSHPVKGSLWKEID